MTKGIVYETTIFMFWVILCVFTLSVNTLVFGMQNRNRGGYSSSGSRTPSTGTLTPGYSSNSAQGSMPTTPTSDSSEALEWDIPNHQSVVFRQMANHENQITVNKFNSTNRTEKALYYEPAVHFIAQVCQQPDNQIGIYASPIWERYAHSRDRKTNEIDHFRIRSCNQQTPQILRLMKKAATYYGVNEDLVVETGATIGFDASSRAQVIGSCQQRDILVPLVLLAMMEAEAEAPKKSVDLHKPPAAACALPALLKPLAGVEAGTQAMTDLHDQSTWTVSPEKRAMSTQVEHQKMATTGTDPRIIDSQHAGTQAGRMISTTEQGTDPGSSWPPAVTRQDASVQVKPKMTQMRTTDTQVELPLTEKRSRDFSGQSEPVASSVTIAQTQTAPALLTSAETQTTNKHWDIDWTHQDVNPPHSKSYVEFKLTDINLLTVLSQNKTLKHFTQQNPEGLKDSMSKLLTNLKVLTSQPTTQQDLKYLSEKKLWEIHDNLAIAERNVQNAIDDLKPGIYKTLYKTQDNPPASFDVETAQAKVKQTEDQTIKATIWFWEVLERTMRPQHFSTP